MEIKLDRKKYNKEFKETYLKCTFKFNVYFDDEKCRIIFKTRLDYKLLITFLLPLLIIFNVASNGILVFKETIISYIEFMKEDIYKTEWIMSNKSWVYKGMCKVLEVEILENRYVED